jgi:hypothetical protein
MARQATDTDIEIVELSPEEGKELLDSQARKYLGISGDEFIRRWETQDFEDPDDTKIVRLSLLIPLARQ